LPRSPHDQATALKSTISQSRAAGQAAVAGARAAQRGAKHAAKEAKHAWKRVKRLTQYGSAAQIAAAKAAAEAKDKLAKAELDVATAHAKWVYLQAHPIASKQGQAALEAKAHAAVLDAAATLAEERLAQDPDNDDKKQDAADKRALATAAKAAADAEFAAAIASGELGPWVSGQRRNLLASLPPPGASLPSRDLAVRR
jgi:colicin import membrane protein